MAYSSDIIRKAMVVILRAPSNLFWWALLLLIIVALSLPIFGTRYHVSFMFFFCLALTLTATYDIVAGYLGYINLGHGAFFGLGAYTFGIAVSGGGDVFLALLLAPLIVGTFALLISVPMMRLKGAYFAIGTFGVLMVMWVLATNLRGLTGGTIGLSITPTESTIITYYLMLGTAVGACFLNGWIATSRFGLALLSIREDEEVAETSGINVALVKRQVIVLSSLLPGIAGALYMWQVTYIDPESSFGPDVTFAAVIMALLGGSGTILGPIIGTSVLMIVEEFLWSRVGYLQLTMYGAVLVLVGIFMPGGLMRSRLFSGTYHWLGGPDHYGYHAAGSAKRHSSTGTSC